MYYYNVIALCKFRTQKVRLYLHHEVVLGHAPVYQQLLQLQPAVHVHGLQDLQGLEAYGLQEGPADVVPGGVLRQSRDAASRVRPPVGSEQTRQTLDGGGTL